MRNEKVDFNRNLIKILMIDTRVGGKSGWKRSKKILKREVKKPYPY